MGSTRHAPARSPRIGNSIGFKLLPRRLPERTCGAAHGSSFPDTATKATPNYPYQSLPVALPANQTPTVSFQDFPNRFATAANQTWTAELGLVAENTATDTAYLIDSFYWGFNVAANTGAITAVTPYSWSSPSSNYINTLTADFNGAGGSTKWTFYSSPGIANEVPMSALHPGARHDHRLVAVGRLGHRRRRVAAEAGGVARHRIGRPTAGHPSACPVFVQGRALNWRQKPPVPRRKGCPAWYGLQRNCDEKRLARHVAASRSALQEASLTSPTMIRGDGLRDRVPGSTRPIPQQPNLWAWVCVPIQAATILPQQAGNLLEKSVFPPTFEAFWNSCDFACQES